MRKFCIFFAVLPLLLAAQNRQSVSFGVRFDTTGSTYLIRQVVTTMADTVLTNANAIRFDSAAAAVSIVESLIEAVKNDSAALQQAYRENTRQRAELDGVLATLKQRTGKGLPPTETPEQVIARLREENARLKGKKE